MEKYLGLSQAQIALEKAIEHQRTIAGAEYPKMLYRLGGDVKLEDGLFTILVVESKEEEKLAAKEGFCQTTKEAKLPPKQDKEK